MTPAHNYVVSIGGMYLCRADRLHDQAIFETGPHLSDAMLLTPVGAADLAAAIRAFPGRMDAEAMPVDAARLMELADEYASCDADVGRWDASDQDYERRDAARAALVSALTALVAQPEPASPMRTCDTCRHRLLQPTAPPCCSCDRHRGWESDR